LIGALLCGCVAAAGFAGPVEDGVAAHDRGDNAEALRLFRLAAAQNNPRAQYNLGLMYQHGDGVTQNYPDALRWYRLAAAQGDATAEDVLGDMYLTGEGVAENKSEAVRWYRLAAARGDVNAVDALGGLNSEK
jgi:TPR repeat protein